MTEQRSAPVYLNLFRIRFPVGAVTSIAHRISGVLLFLSFPFLVYLLDLSLRGPDGFAAAVDWLANGFVRLGSVLIAWSLCHHLFSGIRFLLIDIEQGVTRPRARASAWLVNIAGLVCALLYLWWVL
ncbi:MAG: succinate dehydrogenase, cytochrome b556 subunit [Gammaproteobacteria bacterium]